MNVSYYDILEVRPDASPEIIRAAVRVKLSQHHPDHGGDPEVCKLIIEARDILLDVNLRAEYDVRFGASRKSNRKQQSQPTPSPDPEPDAVPVDGKAKRKCAQCQCDISLFADKCPKCGRSQEGFKLDAPIAKCGACDSLCSQIGDNRSCSSCGCPILRLDGFYSAKIGSVYSKDEIVVRFLSNNKLYVAWGNLEFEGRIAMHSRLYGSTTYREQHIRFLLSSCNSLNPYSSSNWRHAEYTLDGPFLKFQHNTSQGEWDPRTPIRYCGTITAQGIDFTREHWDAERDRWKVFDRPSFTFTETGFES